MLPISFFDRPPSQVAKDLIGKVLRRRFGDLWLSAAIVETEAYGSDKGSHAFLGRTPSRESMWAPAGTIYMYISMGGDSLNISTQGDGQAVLIKAARPWADLISGSDSIEMMHKLNPGTKGKRKNLRLLAGQALLARTLNLKVKDWDGRQFDNEYFFIEDVDYRPTSIIRCRRIGIPLDRDPHLMLRYVDAEYASSATWNPLSKITWKEGHDYELISWKD